MFLIVAASIFLAANPVVPEDESLDLLEKEGIQMVYEEEVVLDEDLDEIDVQEIVFDEIDSETEEAENQE